MGSSVITKGKICLKSQLILSASCLCTRYFNLGGQTDSRNDGHTEGRAGVRMEAGRCQKTSLRSVFAAGTAKRTAEMQRRKSLPVSEDEEAERRTSKGAGKLQPPDRPLPAAGWRKLQELQENPQRFDIRMMNVLFTSGSQLDIAKSLLTFVAEETGTLSYELLLRYLTLCVNGGHDDEVFDIYNIMRGSFPSLDTGACSLFIKSFSRTPRWKEAVTILNEVKKVFNPSPRNYSDVITAAVLHGDMSSAWALYDELIRNGQTPHQETWEALFSSVKKRSEEEVLNETEHQEKLLRILLYMRNNQIYPQQSVANRIKTWFESLAGQTWTGGWTTITSKGVCRCCRSELESIQLSAEEYQELKDRVMTDVIQGRDVFHKTTPQVAPLVHITTLKQLIKHELEQFKAFVKRNAAFDVVIDGLNVANISSDKSKQSDMLLAVVSELEYQGLNVLVLGRKHMLKPSRSWTKHNMSLIQQKARCFFTDNISEDDPFLLYATLHSGNHCRFVSRDLMRDHKACLPDGATRRLFFKWQRGHQLVVDGYVTPGRKVRFQVIPSYDTIVQTTGNSWHVPYDDTEDRSSSEVPQRWLCLTKHSTPVM